MRNLLKIYPETNPYIAVVDGVPWHLNRDQYELILQDMDAGKGMITITYHDPVLKEDRDKPLNLYKITDLDLAKVVQQNQWRKQGGYVCVDGRCVDTAEDCEPKYPKQPEETPSLFAKGDLKKLNQQQRVHLVAGFIFGKHRGFLNRMKQLESARAKDRPVDRDAALAYKFWQENKNVLWVSDRGETKLPQKVKTLEVDKEAVRSTLKSFSWKDPTAAEKCVALLDTVL